MYAIFMTCAIIGGAIMVFQFVMSLIGLGSDAFDIDTIDDVDADFDVDADIDVDTDISAHDAAHVGSSWLFSVISLRTVIAALAFFGLSGLTAQSMTNSQFVPLAVAIVVGLAAMYGVYGLMRWLKGMKAEGTARIQRAVGRYGTVYTTIPADDSGTGKIQLNLQNRTMEYLALTSGHALAPGAKVVVTDVITPTTVAVEPALEPERNDHVQ